MADILNRITKEFRRSVDAQESTGGNMTDWIRNPDLSAVQSRNPRDWVITGDAVRDMTTQEKADRDAALATAAANDMRSGAKTALASEKQGLLLIQRAVLREVLEYTNDLIAKHNSLLTWLGTQTALINRGQLAAMQKTQATMPQAVAAITARIDAGQGE